MKSLWITLLKLIETVPIKDNENLRGSTSHFSKNLYKLALLNKIVLAYLSRVCRVDESEKLFHYHNRRLNVLMKVLTDIVKTLNERSFRYVVFKTLRPFREEVADIDILCLGDEIEYFEITREIESRGYRLMERGLYCTTFEDPRYRFVTEVMIDVYREVSAGPLIYLDKKLLQDHVMVRDVGSVGVKVLDPVAETLVTIGHSMIKERRMILADYLSVLHYISSMTCEQMEQLVELIKRARLVHASRWFFTLATYIHKIVHGFIPEKLRKVINMLGGVVDLDVDVLKYEPPFPCSKRVLLKVFTEKLGDPLFRTSIVNFVSWLSKGRSTYRIANLLVHGT